MSAVRQELVGQTSAVASAPVAPLWQKIGEERRQPQSGELHKIAASQNVNQTRARNQKFIGSWGRVSTRTSSKPAEPSISKALSLPHVAPSPGPPFASGTDMQCMHEIV